MISLEERVLRLEQQVRLWRLLLVSTLAAALLMAASGTPDIVTAREFVLRDSMGNARAHLSMNIVNDPELSLIRGTSELKLVPWQLQIKSKKGSAHILVSDADAWCDLSSDRYRSVLAVSETQGATVFAQTCRPGGPGTLPSGHGCDSHGEVRLSSVEESPTLQIRCEQQTGLVGTIVFANSERDERW